MQALQQKIDYRFNDVSLLKLALTHPSMAEKQNNQRLEFLGDAILGAVVAHMLYEMFPGEAEGELARRQSGLVCREALAQVAQQINLPDALLIAAGEAAAGGRQNPGNLEDAMEALIGAVYLDGGYAAAQAFIQSHWQALAKNTLAPPKDAKTALQEWAQGRGLPLPAYALLGTEGPAHEPLFTVQVCVEGFTPATAEARSKRAAEQQAAQTLLQLLEAANS